MVAVFFYGVIKGDLSNITIGWDADGKGCGYSEGYEDYPYLYWALAPTESEFDAITSANPLSKQKALLNLLNGGVCVKECPNSSDDISEICLGNTAKMAMRGCSGC